MKKLYKYLFIPGMVLLLTLHCAAQDQDSTAWPEEEYTVADTVETNTEAPVEEDTFRVADRVMNESEWKALTADKAFDYKNEKEAEEKIEQQEKGQNWFVKMLISAYAFLFSTLGQVLFWLLVFAIVAYVLYRIFKGDINFIFGRKEKTDNSKTQGPDTLSHEDLVTADWEAKLAAALQAADMRLATRYAFVHILQLLHQHQHISYRIDATNYEYYLALDKEELKPLFRQLLLRYEYAWFGQFDVHNEDWTETMRIYKEIKNKL